MTVNAGTTPQSATINTAFTNALSVTVKDAGTNPVSGVNVTFTAPGSGASGLFSNSTTTITVATNAVGHRVGSVYGERHRGRSLYRDGGGDRAHDGEFLPDQYDGSRVVDDRESGYHSAVGRDQYGLHERSVGNREGRGYELRYRE